MTLNLAERILNGEELTREECLSLLQDETIDTSGLSSGAYIVRKHYYGKRVKLSMILNAKSGICPEDCDYCGQPVKTKKKQRYTLVDQEQIKAGAQITTDRKIGIYCIVMNGRGFSNKEINHICDTVEDIKAIHPQLKICACLGLVDDEQTTQLKEAGVDRYNHSLNTSECYHEEVVSTYTYGGRVNTVGIVEKHNISPCSGVICGMGETDEDIIDMVLTLKEIDADSIPVNFLHPIRGTKSDELDLLSPTRCLRISALFRLINPTKEIRIAGGHEVNLRSLRATALQAADSIFIDDYLVTGGQPNGFDYQMIEDMGSGIDG